MAARGVLRLPPSADPAREALETIAVAINELERLCLEIDAAIAAQDWPRLSTAIADSRRVMHAVENAMAEGAAFRTPDFDKAAFERLQQVFSYRQERLDSLQAIHEEIGERLKKLSLWKTYARAITPKEPTRRSAGLDSTR
jgi:hypothetical protein